MSRMMHFAQDVRGALRNWDKRMMKRMASSIIVDGKRLKTADEVREFFMDCLASGKELLPMGDCEGFDYKTGCPGHEYPDELDSDKAQDVPVVKGEP